MARAAWKPPFVDGYLLDLVKDAASKGSSKPIKTRSRRSTILPNFVGLNFEVYNGKVFIPVGPIKEEMVGFKLGDFSPTRIFKGHSGDKKVKKG